MSAELAREELLLAPTGAVSASSVVSHTEPHHTPSAPSAIAGGHLAAAGRCRRRRAPGRGHGVDDLGDQHHGGDLAGVAAGLGALGDDEVDARRPAGARRARPCRRAQRRRRRGSCARSIRCGGRRAERVGDERGSGGRSATSSSGAVPPAGEPHAPSRDRRRRGRVGEFGARRSGRGCRRRTPGARRGAAPVAAVGRVEAAPVGPDVLRGQRAGRRRTAGRRSRSSIQARSISSCSGLWATAPSTPKPPALVTAATTSRQWLKAKIGNSIPRRSQTSVCMVPCLC